MSEHQFIKTSEYNHIRFITLNNPERYNALNSQMVQELMQALMEADQNENINCIVINGAGKAFCSGADINEFKDTKNNVEAIQKRADLTMSVHLLIPKLTKPVIASVHHYVLAGGCGLALACDLVIAANDAKFAYPEIQRGFVPALVTANLVRIAGRRKAFEMLITGRRVDANEALEINLINKVVPREQLEEATINMAEQVANQSQKALALTKEVFYKTADTPFDEALKIAREINISMRLSDDFNKGVETFVSKKG